MIIYRQWRIVLLGAAVVLTLGGSAQAAPVLLVSIDGLRPGDVLGAQERGQAVPQLRGLLAQGTHASGVEGVLPSFALPSHVTLLTGVSPARHGVYNNLAFLPENAGGALGLDLASAIKVPTLWKAAHAAGLRTASINWPVSLDARGVDFNITVAFKIDEAEEERIAARLIMDQKPDFATIHFGALDEAEHKFGPGSAEAKAALENIDSYIDQLVTAARAAQPDTVVAVVSDHGFTTVTREVNLPRAFVDARLVKLDAAGKLMSWEAVPWAAGGSAAIALARPNDKELIARVAAFPAPASSYLTSSTPPARRRVR